MKKHVLAVLTGCAFALALGSAQAQEKKAPTAQQSKMADCNKEAGDKGLKGDDRKKFMSGCLSAKKEAEKNASTAQQEKMKKCNADASAKSLKGDDRRKFMSGCLKG